MHAPCAVRSIDVPTIGNALHLVTAGRLRAAIATTDHDKRRDSAPFARVLILATDCPTK